MMVMRRSAWRWSPILVRNSDISHLLLLVSLVFLVASIGASNFVVNGPLVTVTIKDGGGITTGSQNAAQNNHDNGRRSDTASGDDGPTRPKKWLDLNGLRPQAVLSVQTKSPPLPNWLPSLKSLRSNVVYDPASRRFLPSRVDTTMKFSDPLFGDLHVQPSFQPGQRGPGLVVQATRGNRASILAKLSLGGRRLVEYVQTSCLLRSPQALSSSVGAIKVETSYDFVRSHPKCSVETMTASGRTKAVLDVESNNPKLSVVHALDSR